MSNSGFAASILANAALCCSPPLNSTPFRFLNDSEKPIELKILFASSLTLFDFYF